MTEMQKARDNLLTKIEQIPFADGILALYNELQNLSLSNYLIIKDKPWLSAFELASIAKFVYIHGHSRKRCNEVDWPSILNAYKDLWRISDNQTLYPDIPEYIAAFVLRFVYQQLPASITPRKLFHNLKRTRRLFGGDSPGAIKLKGQFRIVSGLELNDFLDIAEELYATFTQVHTVPDYRLFESLRMQFNADQITRTLGLLSATRKQFRRYHEEFAAKEPTGTPYEVNSMLRFPILLREDQYWCVFPQFINYAATRGLYFYLSDRVNSFAGTFSEAYEDYVRQLCVDYFGSDKVTTEEEEHNAGWSGKNNDVTLIDREIAILIECKNSGLFSLAKKTAGINELLADIRKNLANADKRKGLFQLYDKIAALRQNQLPEKIRKKYETVKLFYPVVLLHDEIWYANNPHALRNLIDAELKTSGITDFDYQIWHIEEFEIMLRVVPSDQFFNAVQEKFTDPQFRAWDLSTYLAEKYGQTDLNVHIMLPAGESRPFQILRSIADPH